MKVEIGARLKEERERNGLSQAQLAKLAGVAKRTQIAWEQGEQTPNAVYLSVAHQSGIDIGYVVTGVKSFDQAASEIEVQRAFETFQALDEALSNAKKSMPADKKRLAAEALYQAVKAGEGEPFRLAKLMMKAA